MWLIWALAETTLLARLHSQKRTLPQVTAKPQASRSDWLSLPRAKDMQFNAQVISLTTLSLCSFYKHSYFGMQNPHARTLTDIPPPQCGC